MNLIEKSWRQVQTWNQTIVSLILPPSCAYCGESMDIDSVGPQLCVKCLPVFVSSKSRCLACGLELESEQGCYGCRNEKFAFDQVVCLGTYEGQVSEAIVRMKHESGQPLAYALGAVLAQRVRGQISDFADRTNQFDIVTCVPKHWTKRFFTGINSPEIIMAGFAKAANLKSAPDLLHCSRRIRKQSLLSPDQRRRNVRKAWSVSSGYDLNEAQVLVIDDTMTTGATANEMSKALKRQGAERVVFAVVGRAKRSGT